MQISHSGFGVGFHGVATGPVGWQLLLRQLLLHQLALLDVRLPMGSLAGGIAIPRILDLHAVHCLRFTPASSSPPLPHEAHEAHEAQDLVPSASLAPEEVA